jgi:hypothetical protein
MSDSYRMFVELPNGAKFRAQGDVSEVREDAERFYTLLLAAPTATTPDTNGASNGASRASSTTLSELVEDGTPPPAADGLDRATLDRLFAQDRNGTISLRALPRGENAEGDALVALIYGSDRIGNEPQVTGSRLMKAAIQSGLHQVDRIDRSLSAQIGKYVTTAGFKKGRRYGLTNPGIRRAEEILIGILG